VTLRKQGASEQKEDPADKRGEKENCEHICQNRAEPHGPSWKKSVAIREEERPEHQPTMK
jgi:hypothetical protein